MKRLTELFDTATFFMFLKQHIFVNDIIQDSRAIKHICLLGFVQIQTVKGSARGIARHKDLLKM